MTTSENPNNQATVQEPEQERKELTPQQKLKRQKMLVYPLFFLLFAGAMWLIFAPSEKEEQQQRAGLNTELPTPGGTGIVSDKREAYIQDEMQAKQQEKMRSLQDFAFALGEEETPEQPNTAPKFVEDNDEPRNPYSRSNNALRSSAYAYQGVNRQLGSFYQQSEESAGQTEMQSRINELERRLEEERSQKKAEADQLALLEKSYEIAARYMPATQQSPASTPAESVPTTNGKAVVQPVSQVRRNVVSLLSAPISDGEFIDTYSQPRNIGFNTAAGNEGEVNKNSIRACIYRTVTIVDGQEVPLRLLEPMKAGGYTIPVNTVLSGTARISGERMAVTINAVQFAGNVIPIEVQVYDMDGNQGISVPGSEEINAAKEIAANMGSGMGSSITITDDAGSQLLADLGKSAIQGASQYVSKKMRTVKITLKAGHQVLLLPPLK